MCAEIASLNNKAVRNLFCKLFFAIHKRVFTPLRDLPTWIIEAVNHILKSTIAFTEILC